MKTSGASALDQIAREIAIGGLAGLTAGVLVAGIGGRIFMRLAALLDPTAVGLLTANGNRVGDVTLAGTIAFIVFVGPIFGAVAGVLWVAIATWLPGTGVPRAVGAGLVSTAVTPFFVVKAAEPDFQFIGPPLAIIALVATLAALVGIVTAVCADWLRERLPVAPSPAVLVLYRLATLAGLFLVPLAVDAYFRTEVPGYRAPVEVGLALVAVGASTVAWWILRARGVERPPLALVLATRACLALAMILGFAKVWEEASRIIDAFGAAY